MRTLVDGYPLPDDDPDLEIQLKINDYLAGPADERSCMPTAARVMSGTSTREERYRWLVPLLQRAEWAVQHPERARPHWAPHLISAVLILLNHNREQTEQELLALVGYSGLFRATESVGCGAMDEIAPRIVEAFRKTENKQLWVESLDTACLELEQSETPFGGRSAARLGIALMIDPDAPPSKSPCWSSAVAEDLRSMKKPGPAWRAFFSLADTQFIYPHEPAERKVAAALKKIGPADFSVRFNSWTAPLASGQPAHLSWRGLAVLKMLLHGAAAAAGPEIQPGLTALAQANWRQPDRAALALDLLVRAIAMQPATFSRACLDRLAAQPYAKENTALKVALATPERQESPLGIDGYPLDTCPEHSVFQHRLDEWLRQPVDLMHAHHTGPDLHSLALSGAKPDYAGLLAAIIDRLEWMNRHTELIPNVAQMKQVLGTRLPSMLGLREPIERQSLLRLMQGRGKGIFYCLPGDRLFEKLEQHVEANGYDLELVNAIEAWHKASYGSVSDQALRRHLGWILWREDVKPVNLKSCWSARVRQDLREMPPTEAKRWRALLAPMTFHTSDKPPAKWQKEVAPLLAAVGTQEFAARLHRWFEPFRQPEALPLETPGSDLLRSLLWHAAGFEDPRIDEALSWYPQAQWKTKKSRGYTLKLVGPFVDAIARRPPEMALASLEILVERGDILAGDKNYAVYQAVCEKLGRPCREGKAPSPAPTPQDLMSKSLKHLGCQLTADSVTVQGQTDSYVIDRKSHEIRRQSDSELVRVDLGRFPGLDLLACAALSEQMKDFGKILPLIQLLKMDRQFARYIQITT